MCCSFDMGKDFFKPVKVRIPGSFVCHKLLIRCCLKRENLRFWLWSISNYCARLIESKTFDGAVEATSMCVVMGCFVTYMSNDWFPYKSGDNTNRQLRRGAVLKVYDVGRLCCFKQRKSIANKTNHKR